MEKKRKKEEALIKFPKIKKKTKKKLAKGISITKLTFAEVNSP